MLMTCQSLEESLPLAGARLLAPASEGQRLSLELYEGGRTRMVGLTPFHRVQINFIVPKQLSPIPQIAEIEVTPQEPVRCGIIKYELRDLYPEQFVVAPATPRLDGPLLEF
jgi:hypothetical protein